VRRERRVVFPEPGEWMREVSLNGCRTNRLSLVNAIYRLLG
jgi:hypothetical protein